MSRKPVEWGDLMFFLELVRTGTPSAAGKRMKVDHTTVRRRVSALEEGLQTQLIAPKGNTIQLTTEGERLLHYAEAVETLLTRAVEEVAQRDLEISGTVRVGVPEGFGATFLAPHLAEFCRANPQLNVKLMVFARTLNLANREADIAIGFSRPNQQRQISRKLTDYSLSAYASPRYLENAPPLRRRLDLSEHRLVGYVDELDIDGENHLESRDGDINFVGFESTSIGAQKAAVLAGYGIGLLPDFLVDERDGLVKVLADEIQIRKQYWLNLHPEMINLSRVRLVVDFIVELVRQHRPAFLGGAE